MNYIKVFWTIRSKNVSSCRERIHTSHTYSDFSNNIKHLMRYKISPIYVRF